MHDKSFGGCQGPRFAHGGCGREQGLHRRGRGRMGRMFDHGDLRLVILQLIAEKPRHGYELIKAIEEKTSGTYSPSPGVIYPTLTLLEELGQIAAQPGEGARKLYAITPEGEAFLAANRATVEAITARLGAVGEGGPAPQVQRAGENLKLALRLRLSRGPLSDEQARRIAAVLDGAATDIERD
jgi:DNA-binding PadR family transcriptional regulator